MNLIKSNCISVIIQQKGLDKGYDGGKFFIKNSAYMYTRLLEDDQGVDMGIQALPYSELKDVIIPLELRQIILNRTFIY